MKTCRVCGEDKDLSAFYRQKNGSPFLDCKPCWREKVKENRADKIEYYQEYDRKRTDDPKRVAARKAYAESGRYPKEKYNAAKQAYISRNPSKQRARVSINNALRDGKIFRPDRCEKCDVSCTPHGHHEDYSKPLEVVWLCPDCHGARHREINAEHRKDTKAVNVACRATT